MDSVDWKLVIEIYKVLFSWPPIALIMFGVFAGLFRDDIGTFLQNARPAPPGTALKSAIDQPSAGPELEVSSPPLPDEIPAAVTDEALKAAEEAEALETQRRMAATEQQIELAHHYRYLNRFLVLPTQAVLNVIVDNGALPIVALGQLLPNHTPEGRAAIMQALYAHDLIRLEVSMLHPTEKGYSYRHWPERNAWVDAQLAILTTPSPSPPPAPANILAKAGAPTPVNPGGLFGGNPLNR